ncbi:hypothetical protein GCM10007913_37510 [Devosia yakushimensis]|uniref:Uncharacterized protein n=1 Tax=Devosia yakushimensis TaxID=470028 RepID=A0ABQ5UJJ1_9HYPH|nr:hypothetical protein [Devosia yakushimensis]GLQ11819.1 hypothetical protein GCM10007913_37510 [Devosia yakushimensis]
MKMILIVATALMALTVTAHAAGNNKPTTSKPAVSSSLNKTHFFD